MTTAIEKLNEALGAITTEQKGLEGENLILSLKAIRNVVKAMETMAKMTKEEKVKEKTEAGDVEKSEEQGVIRLYKSLVTRGLRLSTPIL